MANVLNRTTKNYRKSVNTPDFPVADWIINPDISLLDGVPRRYWVITGDTVSEMDQAGKDAVDASIAATQEQKAKNGAIADADDNRLLLGFMQVMVDEINILRQATRTTPARTLAQYKTQTKNNIGNQ